MIGSEWIFIVNIKLQFIDWPRVSTHLALSDDSIDRRSSRAFHGHSLRIKLLLLLFKSTAFEY